MFERVKIHTVLLKIGRGKGKEARILLAGNETVQHGPSLASLPAPRPARCCLSVLPRASEQRPSLRGVAPAQVTEESQRVALSGWAPSLGPTEGAGRRVRHP